MLKWVADSTLLIIINFASCIINKGITNAPEPNNSWPRNKILDSKFLKGNVTWKRGVHKPQICSSVSINEL